ncbi:unnamed protein product [Sphagnum tenellum]
MASWKKQQQQHCNKSNVSGNVVELASSSLLRHKWGRAVSRPAAAAAAPQTAVRRKEGRQWAPFSKWRLDKKRVCNKEMGILHQ